MDTRRIDALLRQHLDLPETVRFIMGYDVPAPSPSESWEGMGQVVEAMDAKGFEWHVWPKAVEFSQKHKHWENPLISGYAEGHGHKMNTALAALRCLGPELPNGS